MASQPPQACFLFKANYYKVLHFPIMFFKIFSLFCSLKDLPLKLSQLENAMFLFLYSLITTVFLCYPTLPVGLHFMNQNLMQIPNLYFINN